ncbi:MAG: glycosyltransferase [Lachnospiraceae bacterium]|nr:glycosyltransferase [Lachnospiraceae bacterium]
MKNDEPLISVIVPVYNGQDYLENCIRSIEDQTYGNLEVIIVNDGSTDDTAAVCDRLKGDYDNVSVLTLGDVGVSAARNAGIDAAGGDFITFVDADDRLCAGTVRTLYDCMINTESDVAGCGFFEWSDEEDWTRGAAAESENGRVVTYDAGKYLKDAVLCGNSRCWSKLYRREIFDKVLFPEKLSIGEDMLFLVRMLPYVGRIAETDYKGYGYYRNPSGAINREFTPGYMDQITCWQLAREEVLRIDRSLDARVTTLYMMGIMLTAGKLAMLPAADRRKQQKYIRVCHDSLKAAMRVSGAYGGLSTGYRIKVRVFLLCPGLYLYLYHLRKAVH